MTNWDNSTWMVRGKRHAAEVGRLVAYVASQGGEGIILGGDLKPRPRAQAGAGITLDPGALVVRNRFSNAGGAQSYYGRLPILEDVPIRPTSSTGGRSDLVVGEVIDPQYVGDPVADMVSFQPMVTSVIEGVSLAITKASQLGLPRSMTEICRVDQQASNSQIGNGPGGTIVDLRKLANARNHPEHAAASDLNVDHVKAAAPSFRQFSGFAPQFFVPEWASQVTIKTTMSQAINYSGETVGSFNNVIGAGSQRVFGPPVIWDEKDPVTSDGIRHTYIIPSINLDCRKFAGTVQPVALWAETGIGVLSMRSWAQLLIEVVFHERVV